ncbi:hypothetical protein Plhal304r1_c017g0061121 [Plasmopara halstedii]
MARVQCCDSYCVDPVDEKDGLNLSQSDGTAELSLPRDGSTVRRNEISRASGEKHQSIVNEATEAV